jgi:hypothetical protein
MGEALGKPWAGQGPRPAGSGLNDVQLRVYVWNRHGVVKLLIVLIDRDLPMSSIYISYLISYYIRNHVALAS